MHPFIPEAQHGVEQNIRVAEIRVKLECVRPHENSPNFLMTGFPLMKSSHDHFHSKCLKILLSERMHKD